MEADEAEKARQEALERELKERREKQEREEAETVIARSKVATGTSSPTMGRLFDPSQE